MGRKTKSKSVHLSLRIPESLASTVVQLAKVTGWSDSKALVWLAQMGNRLLTDSGMTSDQATRELDAWKNRHTAEQAADQMKREAAAAVRAILSGDLAKGIKVPRSKRSPKGTTLKAALTAASNRTSA